MNRDAKTKVGLDRSGVIHVVGGGTISHVRPHLALCAPAYGWTAKKIVKFARQYWAEEDFSVEMHLTRMACGKRRAPETNEDVKRLLQNIVRRPSTKIVFLPIAVCDYEGAIMDGAIPTTSGKEMRRLRTRDGDQMMHLTAADKLIGDVRKYRKDLFLVGFKTTSDMNLDEQFTAGLELMQRDLCNLVFVSDVHTDYCMVITPERTRHYETKNKCDALEGLVSMVHVRSSKAIVSEWLAETASATA